MGEGAPVRGEIKAKHRFAIQLAAPVRVLTGRDSRLAREPRFSAFPRANAVEIAIAIFSRFGDPYFETGTSFASFVPKRSAVLWACIFALGATTTLMTSEGGWFIAD